MLTENTIAYKILSQPSVSSILDAAWGDGNTMTNRPTICVIGSINLDFVIRTKTLPTAGETLGGGDFITTPGGKGANQALAAKRLGADASLLGCIGDDQYGDSALENLRRDGVDLAGIRVLQSIMSGAAFINLSEDGENQIAVAPGSNAAFAPDHLPPIAADAIIAQLEVAPETILAAVSDTDVFFCLNAAPALPISPTLLNRADLLVVNETEYEFYKDHLADFSGLLARTYGAKGASLFSSGQEIARCAGYRVDTVDTTGAGDCFTAALTVFLMEQLDHTTALERACMCAALATTKTGAQTGMPYRAQAEAFFAS